MTTTPYFDRNRRAFLPGIIALTAYVAQVQAMEAMDDEALARVNAQEGATIGLNSAGVTAGNIEWRLREPVLGASYQASMNLQGLAINPVSTVGAVTGLLDIETTMDVGGDTSSNDVALAISSNWTRQRVLLNGISHSTDSSKSLGSIAYNSAGSFGFMIPFDATGPTTGAILRWQSNDGDLFYSQGTGAELVLNDIDVNVGFSNGTIRVDKTDGIVLQAPAFDTNISAYLAYRANVGSNTFRTDSQLVRSMYYGVSGNISNFWFNLASGGISLPSGGSNIESTGAHGLLKGDLTDFAWTVGEGASSGARISFYDHEPIPGWLTAGQRQLSLPFYVDVLNTNQGPKLVGESTSGLCFGDNANGSTGCTAAGSFFVPSEPDAGAFGLFIRDGRLAAYPSRVDVLDGSTTTYRWGLITAIEDLDANVYLYPGGNGSNTGIRADVLVLMQDHTPANGQKGSHFAIADTAPQGNTANPTQYMGLTSSDAMLMANDLYIKLARSTADGGTDAASGLRLSTNDVRLKLNGTLTAGRLDSIPTSTANTTYATRLMEVGLDLFGRVDLYLTTPPAGEDYLGFEGSVTLVDGPGSDKSYLSLAEPSRPDVDIRLNRLRGTITISNGQLDIVPTSLGGPRLELNQTLSFSNTDPFRIDRLQLGSSALGRIAIPSGQLRSSVALMPQ